MQLCSIRRPQFSMKTCSPRTAARPRMSSGRRKRPELLLQPLEPGLGDDRLLVDRVPLQGRQRLLIRHLHGPEHREAPEAELRGRQELRQEAQVGRAVQEAPFVLLRQRPEPPGHIDLHEAPVHVHPEVAVEAGVGVRDREDQGALEAELDAVEPAQDEGVGVEEPHPGQRLLERLVGGDPLLPEGHQRREAQPAPDRESPGVERDRKPRVDGRPGRRAHASPLSGHALPSL